MLQQGIEIYFEQAMDISKRLQKIAGFYKIHPNTIQIDVTDCKSVEESTDKVLEKYLHIKRILNSYLSTIRVIKSLR